MIDDGRAATIIRLPDTHISTCGVREITEPGGLHYYWCMGYTHTSIEGLAQRIHAAWNAPEPAYIHSTPQAAYDRACGIFD